MRTIGNEVNDDRLIRSADQQVSRIDLGSMDVTPVAALWCCTLSSLRRTSSAVTGCLEHNVAT
jgi:hypothetical protein